MNPRWVELILRRERLITESSALRRNLVYAAQDCRPIFASMDRVAQALNWVRRHPALLVAVATALIVARPRAVLSLLGRGFVLWRLARRVQAGQSLLGSLGTSFLGREKKKTAARSAERSQR